MTDTILRCDPLPAIREQKAQLLRIIEKVIDSGIFILGEDVKRFESEFASYVGCPYGIGFGNATDALVYGLKALGVGEGDEVVTTSFSAVPTLAAILMSGAEPVFADVDPDTYLVNAASMLDCVSPKTKAVIPVHIFGNVFDTKSLRAKLDPSIAILEDCAQAHGAAMNKKKAGSAGTLAAFSFYPTKNLGGLGDGGLLTTHDERLAAKLRLIRNYGLVNKDETICAGGNSRLDSLQAAILSYRLQLLEGQNKLRCEKVALYAEHLSRDIFDPQHVSSGATSCYHVFCGRVPEKRDELIRYLSEKGIQSNVYYVKPLSQQEAYLGRYGKKTATPNCELVCRSVIALPMYPEIPDGHIVTVCKAIKRFYGK